MPSDIHALPESFLERLRAIIPARKWHETIRTFTDPRPTSFRVNALKATALAVRTSLEERGFLLERVAWCAEAFLLRRGTLRELQATLEYQTGQVYVQHLSSLVPVLVLRPQPGEQILDMTAAPGSKTTQIASLMQGQGRLVANDNNRVRFFKLKANVELQGAGHVELMCRYGETLGRQFPEQFDRVLLDAPCSAEGRFHVRQPASYRYWKPRKVLEMARKQRRLFAAGLAALRPGGIMVYATCTFAPEENEGVLHWALTKGPGAMAVEAIDLPFPNVMRGLTSWRGDTWHPAVRQAMRILPTAHMEGFFLAKIRKTEGPGSKPSRAGEHL